jgi:hypothetical protein
MSQISEVFLVLRRGGKEMEKGGRRGYVLIPRNPLLKTAIPSDADDDAAVVRFHAVGCFEAGDDLRKSPSKLALPFLP